MLATVVHVRDERRTAPARRAGRARARLLAFCTRELERYRGRLVQQDASGLLATFDGPARAVRCASLIAEAARRLERAVPRRRAHGRVRDRGRRPTDRTVRGPAVDVARSVADAASPCEVVVSRTVRDLVAGAGLTFRSHAQSGRRWRRQLLPLFMVETHT